MAENLEPYTRSTGGKIVCISEVLLYLCGPAVVIMCNGMTEELDHSRHLRPVRKVVGLLYTQHLFRVVDGLQYGCSICVAAALPTMEIRCAQDILIVVKYSGVGKRCWADIGRRSGEG